MLMINTTVTTISWIYKLNEAEAAALCVFVRIGDEGNAETTQTLLECGVVETLDETLGLSATKMVRPMLWTLGNICAGNEEQIQAVLNAGVMKQMEALIHNSDVSL